MGTLTVAGMSAGLLTGGQKTMGPLTTTGTNIVGTIIDQALNTGDNTFTVPTGASKVLIDLGQSCSATVKLRTNVNSTDAGLEIAPYTGIGWTAFDLVSGVTSLILNASTSVAAIELSFI